MKFVIIGIHKEKYAISTQHVKSIEKIQNIQMIPQAKRFVTGVINLRGHIMTVMDLREILGFEPAPFTNNTRFMIANHHAYIIDAAQDIVEIDEEQMEDWSQQNALIKGVWQHGDDLILVIDEEALSSHESHIEFSV